MKRFIIYLICVLACGCSLEEGTPYGQFTNQSFYQTKEDALSALRYAYQALHDIDYCGRFLQNLNDLTTDACIAYPGKYIESLVVNWEITPETDEILYFFKYAYMSNNRALSVIENVSKMDGITTSDRNQIVGEAHFLLGFNYFMLVRMYGEVPVRREAIKSISQIHASKSSIQDVYTFIIENLEAAIGLTGIQKLQGRGDKVAAQATLAKVYLTMASSKKTGVPGYEWVDSDDCYRLAAEYASEVLEKQSTYALDPDLLNIYDVDHYIDGCEHIFMTSMNRNTDGSTWSVLPQMFGCGYPEFYISRELDGNGGDASKVQRWIGYTMNCWSSYCPSTKFYGEYDDADWRKKLFVTTIYDKNGNVLDTYSPNSSIFYFPMVRKFTDPHSTTTTTSANLDLIRFAEVALIYAEAVGPTEKGYYWLNQVRARAGLPALSGLSSSAYEEAVWRENILEFAYEGKHLFELRRTNRVNSANITLKTIKPEYAYFFPLPQREIDLNDGL